MLLLPPTPRGGSVRDLRSREPIPQWLRFPVYWRSGRDIFSRCVRLVSIRRRRRDCWDPRLLERPPALLGEWARDRLWRWSVVRLPRARWTARQSTPQQKFMIGVEDGPTHREDSGATSFGLFFPDRNAWFWKKCWTQTTYWLCSVKKLLFRADSQTPWVVHRDEVVDVVGFALRRVQRRQSKAADTSRAHQSSRGKASNAAGQIC